MPIAWQYLSGRAVNFLSGYTDRGIIMYASITAQVVNVICNYIFIYGKFGFPAMGIAGAAWGTFAGASVGGLMRLVMFVTGDINRKFNSRKMMHIDFGENKKSFKNRTSGRF